MNWNTVFLTIGFPVLFGSTKWMGNELYKEMRRTHDAVVILQTQVVPRTEFEVKMLEIRTRLGAMELDIQKLKDERKP